tara:strand:- start:4914 stop:5162 length:249 start_codon:yes stop_codon:yes gene_type:complete
MLQRFVKFVRQDILIMILCRTQHANSVRLVVIIVTVHWSAFHAQLDVLQHCLPQFQSILVLNVLLVNIQVTATQFAKDVALG